MMRNDLRQCLKDCDAQEENYSSSLIILKMVEKERRKKLVKLLKLQIKTFDRRRP